MDGENGTGHDMVPILQNLPAKYTEDEYQTLHDNYQRERERELLVSTHQRFFITFRIENTFVSLQKRLVVIRLSIL